jgi:putative dGTPase
MENNEINEAKLLNLTKNEIEKIVEQYQLITNENLVKREFKNEGYSVRDEYQRDYARILYSPSFRRLQGKMQIMGIKSDAFYRNRLTHSLEVAQIARSIAYLLSNTCKNECEKRKIKQMYKDDIYVLDAAALAHDIGHPAFGHKGERVLDEIAKESDKRFEGNAQNYRVLRKLEIKDPNWQGLNLTFRTLLAINKYIVSEVNAKDKENNDENIKAGEKKENLSKFMYDEDYQMLNEMRKKNNLLKQRTLDVQIIELADDIAYAVHDLEDALALRKFNVDEVLFLLKSKEPQNVYKQFEEIVDEAKRYAYDNKTNIQEYSKIFRLKLTSLLTNKFVHDIRLRKVIKKDVVKYGIKEDNMELTLDNYKQLLKSLKDSVFECSTRDTDIQEYEMKGEIIIKTLYKIYSNTKENEKEKLLPPSYRKGNPQEDSINYIAGMMDTFAISKFEEHTGIEFDKIDLSN